MADKKPGLAIVIAEKGAKARKDREGDRSGADADMGSEVLAAIEAGDGARLGSALRDIVRSCMDDYG